MSFQVIGLQIFSENWLAIWAIKTSAFLLHLCEITVQHLKPLGIFLLSSLLWMPCLGLGPMEFSFNWGKGQEQEELAELKLNWSEAELCRFTFGPFLVGYCQGLSQSGKAILTLLPFSRPYQCEVRFSSPTATKTETELRRKSLVRAFFPRYQLCSPKQAQVSCWVCRKRDFHLL